MKYFEKLPLVEYTTDDEQIALMRNIFYNFKLNISGKNYYKLYKISNIKRLDQISYELYGTTEYWWILAYINGIVDIIFDLPLESEILHQIALEEAKEIPEYLEEDGTLNVDGMDYYVDRVDELEAENDLKRTIKVIAPEAITDVIYHINKS